MSDLLSVKTGSGVVTITESAVTLTRNAGQHTERMQRANITGIDFRTTVMGVFGIGGAKRITLRGLAGEKMVIGLIKPQDAKAIMALLKR
jgi:hypothetical protein